MTPELQGLLGLLEDTLRKHSFVDPAAFQGGGMPPGGDPAAMGGDPAMMGGDPAMMGGDPSMMGGAPPMDPAAAGGAPPMDPAMMGGGGMPPMDPAMLQQMMGGGEGGEAGTAAVDPSTGAPIVAKKIDNSVLNYMLLRMMAHQMGIPQELLTMPKQEAEQVQPGPAGGGGGGGGGAAPAGAIPPITPIQPAMPKQASSVPSLQETAARNAGLAYLLERGNHVRCGTR